jgi:DNA repair exonuclease SbcCD ATPase subunit
MSFAVLHMQKLKSPAIKGMQIHNQREKESHTNPDIDGSKTHLNYDFVNQSNIDYNEKINKRIQEGVTTGKAIRKDAVKLASFLVTSDKEFFDRLPEREEKRFFESAYEFFCEKYGEKNIAYATVHKDEKTPHMHVGFVPITEDGRLSAKDFFGKKQQLVKLQDEFHEHMREAGFDVERGVSSDRKHIETAKYKALTFQQMEREAQAKYERTMEHIQKIDEHTKSIENIEAKKLLGLVGMKESDYKSLVDYATNGVVFQVQVENLQKELDKAKKEIVQLKTDLKMGQDKIRGHYKDIQVENEELKENLDALATRKANEKIKEADVVTKHEALIDKYNELANKYNDQLKEKKELKQKVYELTMENRSYRNENRELKEKVLAISKQFSAFKERVTKVLGYQIDRIKTWLNINNVDRNKIKFLEDNREKFVQDSLAKMEQPERPKQRDMGLER